MIKPWIFLSNTFEVQTRGSNIKMLSLATDTDAKLMNENADPDILNLYNILNPAYNTYRQVCINYDMVEGSYGGGTLAFENLLDTLPQQLRIWESGVRAVYYEDTPEERAIFPRKRNPFNSGTYEDRLSAVGTLAASLQPIVALAATYTLVNNFYNLALSTRLAQQQGEGALGQVSVLREQQRKLVAIALFGVYGGLILKYRAEPLQVARFFDLELLRQSPAEPLGITAAGKVIDAITSNPVVNAAVKFILPDNAIITAQTDANGNFEADLGEYDDTINVMIQVSAAGYITFNEGGPVEPGEDVTVNIQLQPTPIPPMP